MNEGWHIYRIAESVILIGVVFLVSTSSDLAIDPQFFWQLTSLYWMIRSKNFKDLWEVVQNEETS